jgi:exodeoxyribonuclease VII small subunit
VAERGGGARKPGPVEPAASNATGRPSSDETTRPPYEQARDELTELVRRLETGGLTLAESLQLWERGEELALICEDWLEGARARLAAALDHNSGNEPGAPF